MATRSRALRGVPGGSQARIIALTGWGQDEDRQRARAAGFDDHLVKPVDIAALTQVLESVAPAPPAASIASAAPPAASASSPSTAAADPP